LDAVTGSAGLLCLQLGLHVMGCVGQQRGVARCGAPCVGCLGRLDGSTTLHLLPGSVVTSQPAVQPRSGWVWQSFTAVSGGKGPGGRDICPHESLWSLLSLWLSQWECCVICGASTGLLWLPWWMSQTAPESMLPVAEHTLCTYLACAWPATGFMGRPCNWY